MELLLGIGVIVAIYVVCKVIPEQRFDNYMPPDGYQVDHGKMNRDIGTGVSKDEVMRRTTSGYYNVRRK